MEKIAKNCIKGTKRFFYSPITEGLMTIEGQEAKHMLRVLRLNIGEKVEFFDGQGTLAYGTITDTGKSSLDIDIENVSQIEPNHPQCPVIIAASVAKSDRFEWLISKCTELGVNKVYPMTCERTVKQPGNAKKLAERYHNLVVAAGKQSLNLHLPEIAQPLSIADIINETHAKYPNANLLIGSPDDSAGKIIDTFSPAVANIAFIGPEGGFTDQEIELLKAVGAKEVRMTQTILRIETAAIAFASILCTMRDSME